MTTNGNTTTIGPIGITITEKKPKRGRAARKKRWWMVYLGTDPIWTVDADTEEQALATAREVTNNRPVTVREMGK